MYNNHYHTVHVGTNIHCAMHQKNEDRIYIMAWASNHANYITY